MQAKQDISSRSEVAQLVFAFYQNIRADDMLGPVFNGIVNDWDEHYELLTDFWSNNLFAERVYSGNPILAHQQVDQHMKGKMEAAHFGRWLMHWHQTIDQLFEGKNATILKRRAQKMSTFILLKVVGAREE